MSISQCQYCSRIYDEDINVEHEEECKLQWEEVEAQESLESRIKFIESIENDN